MMHGIRTHPATHRSSGSAGRVCIAFAGLEDTEDTEDTEEPLPFKRRKLFEVDFDGQGLAGASMTHYTILEPLRGATGGGEEI
jgi:hypothetical protein